MQYGIISGWLLWIVDEELIWHRNLAGPLLPCNYFWIEEGQHNQSMCDIGNLKSKSKIKFRQFFVLFCISAMTWRNSLLVRVPSVFFRIRSFSILTVGFVVDIVVNTKLPRQNSSRLIGEYIIRKKIRFLENILFFKSFLCCMDIHWGFPMHAVWIFHIYQKNAFMHWCNI